MNLVAGDRFFSGRIQTTRKEFSIGRIGDDDLERTGREMMAQRPQVLVEDRNTVMKLVQQDVSLCDICQPFLNFDAHEGMGLRRL